MTTPWLYDENSQVYTKICDFWLLRTWFMAQHDSALKRTKKHWSVQHDAEKDVATSEKLANYLGASCFFTCWHSNTADGIGEPQSPRAFIYIYIHICVCVGLILPPPLNFYIHWRSSIGVYFSHPLWTSTFIEALQKGFNSPTSG